MSPKLGPQELVEGDAGALLQTRQKGVDAA
jgi:hypothetical protein